MTLKPLGNRVLIKPAETPKQTASGLHLAEHWKPEQLGTVVAVGTPRHPLKAEAEEIAIRVGHRRSDDPPCRCEHCEAERLLLELVRREPCCAVGDLVLFSWAAGQEIFLHESDERFLLLTEDDLLAILEPA